MMRPDKPVNLDFIEHLRTLSSPLHDGKDLDPLMRRIGEASLVLLGEASHGTSEFYTWRTLISQKLMEEKNFAFIAVEGDWPDCYRINQYIKGQLPSVQSSRQLLSGFKRWPTWMWANEEIIELVDWLKDFNEQRPKDRKIGFYGLDVYSLWDSLAELSHSLKDQDVASKSVLDRVFHCFERFGNDAHDYANAMVYNKGSCENVIEKLLVQLQQRNPMEDQEDSDRQFEIEQNAWVLKNAEAYYRAMIYQGPDSWNIRDTHMADTLDRLLRHYGSRAKGIVWAHNTHIGDARFTDMADEGEINIGQIARERHGQKNVVLIGFSSYEGEVIAGRKWDAPRQVMTVPKGRLNSWEELLHRNSPEDKLLIFSEQEFPQDMLEFRGHRAIGVVYHPEHEQLGNYVPTSLPKRYDAILYFDLTHALEPLTIKPQHDKELPDTYPSMV